MIHWIKGLFTVGVEVDNAPFFEDPATWKDPYEATTRSSKNISEPVLSFIKCVRENPKRFVVKSDYEYFGLKISNSLVIRSTEPERYHFCLEDKVTKESWTLCKDIVLSFYSGFKESKHTYNPEWLTEDEKEYLITSIKTIFHDRRDRKQKLQEIRKQRRNRDERNRLKEIYK